MILMLVGECLFELVFLKSQISSDRTAVFYRLRIRCQKIFAVPGNHDKQARKLKEDFLWLDNLAEVSIHGQPIVLCHYALRVWNQSNRGSWHLYGHSHGRLPEVPNSLSMDVGVDTHEFRPWHYDEIAGVMRRRSEARDGRRMLEDAVKTWSRRVDSRACGFS